MSHLLLMSSSRQGNLGYLVHAHSQLRRFVETEKLELLLIPYADVAANYDEVESSVRTALAPTGLTVQSLHRARDPIHAIRQARAIAVAGGNTFVLLKRLYETGLVQIIRERVLAGIPYIGWSAGANIACPTIQTSNDMIITEPVSLNGLALVPFQINPHYVADPLAGYHLQARNERLREFLIMNPRRAVIALPEGSALLCHDDYVEVIGERGAFYFTTDGVQFWAEDHRCEIAATTPMIGSSRGCS